MTDDKQTPAVHENHYCSVEGCQRWGAWGHSRTKAEPVQWWCQEHYPHHNKARQEAIDIADMLGGRTTPQN